MPENAGPGECTPLAPREASIRTHINQQFTATFNTHLPLAEREEYIIAQTLTGQLAPCR